MSREYLGHAVVDGVPQFFSVSAVERFDPRSNGCPRKWWYRYVQGIKDAPSDSKDAGIALHAELRDYLRTGVKALSNLALSGLHMVPDPGPDLLVEQSIGGPKNPILTADGVPFIGDVDLAHDRCTNKGGEDIGDTIDPPGTVEVIDWKWKRDGSRVEYYLQSGELVKSIQMSGYGEWARRVFPDKTHVRLSHGYFPSTRGKPRKVTRLHVIDDCARSWEYVEGLARAIKHVARETSPETVDANTGACGSYGGCPHRDHCTAYKRNSLTSTSAMIFGETASKEIHMGLLQQLSPQLQQQPAPATAVDLRLQLAREEAAQRAQAQSVQQQGPLDFARAWAIIEAGGRGQPALGGAAAQTYAAMKGYTDLPNGAGYAGTGDLGAIMFLDPSHVIQLGGEMRGPVVQPAQQPPVMQHFAPPSGVPSFLPPDAPASNPALAAKPLEPAIPAQNPPAAEIPAARTRKPRAPKASPAPVAQQPQAASPQGMQVASTGDAGDLEVFVDAIPNREFESLAPYVDNMLAFLSKTYNPNGLQDVRCAPKESPLGYGGWRGAVRAIVIEKPPQPATYYLDTRNNELMAEVADAMRVVCERTQSLYVRGVR